MDRAVKVMFDKHRRDCTGHPGWCSDLREEGWTVSEKTVAELDAPARA
jgi:putative transposase